MKTLNEMRELVYSGKLKTLTIDAARELKGKRIQTIYFGYAHQDHTEEFVVGDIVSELEFYRTLKEDCYPDRHGHQNRAEYWESYMTKKELESRRQTLILLREDGTNTFMFIDDLDKETFMCSDNDRPVWYLV